MIKQVKYFVLIMITLLIGITSVDAARKNSCPTDVKRDLGKIAAYVKFNYEVIDDSTYGELTADGQTTKYKIPNYTFQMTAYNVTEEIYLTIEGNKVTEDGRTVKIKGVDVYYDDTNEGKYTFDDDNFGQIVQYTVQVKSNNPKCSGSIIRTMRLTRPMYNAYSEFAYCQNSNSYYCQRFVGTDLKLKGDKDFIKKIGANNKNPDEKEENTIIEILKENWKLYLGIFVGMTILFVGLTFFLKWYKRRKETHL